MSKLKPRTPIKGRTLAELAEALRNRPRRSRSKVTMIDGLPHQ